MDSAPSHQRSRRGTSRGSRVSTPLHAPRRSHNVQPISRTPSNMARPSGSTTRDSYAAQGINDTSSIQLDSSVFATSPFPPRRRQLASAISGRKSRATSSIWDSDDYQVICAISEARGVSPSVGIAIMNTTTNEAILSQMCDTQFYVKTIHKIQIYNPSTILMVHTAFPPNPKSSLLSILEEELQGSSIEALDRRYWSESGGLELINTLAFREDLEALKLVIEGNFYAICAFSAVTKYVHLACHLAIMPHSLRIRYQPSENSMLVDTSTVNSLELIQSNESSRSKNCLFGLLNETLTPMGARMLRSNILQPSTQVEHTITPRLDALDELTVKEDTFFQIRHALKRFSDVEKLLTTVRGSFDRDIEWFTHILKLVIVPERASIYESELSINYVLMIKTFVLAVPDLYESLETAQATLLQRIREVLRPELIQPIIDLISTVINDDVVYVESPLDRYHQRTYAVKSGVHGMLDVARQTYKEGTDDVHQHIEDLNAQYDLVADLRFEQTRKYWLRIREVDLEDRDIPDILINRLQKNGFLECQTLILVQLNNRITDSHNEAVMLSDRVIRDLLDEIRGHVGDLFRVCEGISLLDMIASFGQSVTTRDYMRPEFGDTLALKAARHPICDKMMAEQFVPNDVYADVHHRFQIVTGSNMSGKSTYIRMIPLLQIMAQIGCFVPAEYAAFSVVEQLFVRTSTDDSIEANMSTFSIEMREMAFILRNINGKSLTIIDELGRGTSTRDGLAIALSMSEALIQSNSLVWFATHFHPLTRVLGRRPGVLNIHLTTNMSLASDGQTPKMTMLYKINSGPIQESHYGLDLAKAVGFPDKFIQTAESVAETLRRQIEEKEHSSRSRKVILKRKLVLNLHETLKQLHSSSMDDEALGSYLKKLQDEFVSRMHDIEYGHEITTEG
ncbi:muts domain V-domain-containing protein [Xylariales sp. PMI_506]|nr:muts domain V-domain-containing protein [Xylariales sp. PMI_506]